MGIGETRVTSRRTNWDAMPPVQGMRFTVRGIEAATTNDALSTYLRSANLRIVELEPSDSLRLQMARFPDVTFAHVHLPRAVVEWPRDELSLTRAAIVVRLSGRLAITSDATVVHRRPGLALIPPGDTPVAFETLDPLNELLYISTPGTLVHDLDVKPDAGTARPEIPANVLAPLLAFTSSLSSGSVGDSVVLGPLRSVALEVARALARLIAEGDPSELTLFSRAIRLIVENHADARLTVPRLAAMAGVSPRSLQVAFAAEGTTVARELRATRSRAARELRELHPGLPASQIARTVGFGSVSTLYRAMELDAPAAEG